MNISKAEGYLPYEFNPEDNTIILIHGQGGGVGHEFNTLIMRGKSFYKQLNLDTPIVS